MSKSRCEACCSIYFFTTVAWSRQHAIRIIALAPVSKDSWPRLITFFEEEPSGQQWIPTMLKRPTDQELDRIEGFLKSVTSEAGATIFLLAWDIKAHKALGARKVNGLPTPSALNMFDPSWIGTKSAADWFAEFGMRLPEDL